MTPEELGCLKKDAERYRWLRDVATGPERDDCLGAPCGKTADEPGYYEAHAKAVDDAINGYLVKLSRATLRKQNDI